MQELVDDGLRLPLDLLFRQGRSFWDLDYRLRFHCQHTGKKTVTAASVLRATRRRVHHHMTQTYISVCSSPGSLTLLRSGSVLSSVTLGLRGSAPSRSRSLRGSSGVWLSSSKSFALPPLMYGPGRDDGGVEISGLSLRSLPVLLRLLGGKKNKLNVLEAQ